MEDSENSYFNKNGVRCCMLSEKMRNDHLQKFLAYHSFYIGQQDNKTVLYLEFNGDEEILSIVKFPNEYKHKLVWKKLEELTEEFKDLSHLNGLEMSENFTYSFIKVNKLDEVDILTVSFLKFLSYQLFTEELLPWKVNNGNSFTLLSMFQKELLCKDTECQFYLNGNVYEPLIGEKSRKSLYIELASRIFSKHSNENSKVIHFNFKQGDRDVLTALSGVKTFYTIEEYEKFEDFCDEKEGFVHFVFDTYVPGTDKILISAYNKIPAE